MSQDPLPALDRNHFAPPSRARLSGPVSRHLPRFLLLHGSLRARSYSRLLADEAERLPIAMGCETRRFDAPGSHDERLEKVGKEAAASRSTAGARTG